MRFSGISSLGVVCSAISLAELSPHANAQFLKATVRTLTEEEVRETSGVGDVEDQSDRGRKLNDPFPDEFFEEVFVEVKFACGVYSDIKEKVEAAFMSYYRKLFEDYEDCKVEQKDTTSFTLFEWENAEDCDGYPYRRGLEEEGGEGDAHVESRELQRKKRKSQGRGRRKGKCNGCNRNRRRVQESFIIDLSVKDRNLLDTGRKLGDGVCKANLSKELQGTGLAGFKKADVTREKERVAQCEDKHSYDCKKSDICCGSPWCFCDIVGPSLCQSEWCCIQDAEPFKPNLCANVGGCGPHPCPPTPAPTKVPSESPSSSPTDQPSQSPSSSPSDQPSVSPSSSPTTSPSDIPSDAPSDEPTYSSQPSESPSSSPSESPSESPSDAPSGSPSESPSDSPSDMPTALCPDEEDAPKHGDEGCRPAQIHCEYDCCCSPGVYDYRRDRRELVEPEPICQEDKYFCSCDADTQTWKCGRVDGANLCDSEEVVSPPDFNISVDCSANEVDEYDETDHLYCHAEETSNVKYDEKDLPDDFNNETASECSHEVVHFDSDQMNGLKTTWEIVHTRGNVADVNVHSLCNNDGVEDGLQTLVRIYEIYDPYVSYVYDQFAIYGYLCFNSFFLDCSDSSNHDVTTTLAEGYKYLIVATGATRKPGQPTQCLPRNQLNGLFD